MTRSLRLRQFAIILTMTVVVVLMSRSFAQYRSGNQFLQELHIDMQAGLTRCAHVTESQSEFLKCNSPFFKNYLFNRLSGEITLCRNGEVVGEWGDRSSCILIARENNFWSGANLSTEPLVQLVVNTMGGEMWHIARLTVHPEIQILMREQDFQHVLSVIYKVRDQQLPLFIPLLLLAGLLMAHFLVSATVGPLKALKASLKNLKPESLKNAPIVTTPYQEFDDFVTVYNDLLNRLHNSFTKAKRFSSDAAHELRTPLAILRGQAEDLIAGVPTGSPLQVRLRSMSDEIERLIEISEKLLLLSKADAQMIEQELSDFALSEFIDELAEESALYHPNVRIKKSIQHHVIWHCDRSLIQQLIHNLYSNAVKYNIPDGWITFTLSSDDHMLELAIENPSENIPDDLNEKAFDRFYRGDVARARKVGGTGLGLSICSEIAKLHHATLTLKSTLSQSVIVKLRAPLNEVNAMNITKSSC